MDLVTEVADRAARRLIRWETEAVRRNTPELPPGPLAPERAQLLAFLLTPGPFLRACRERNGKVVTIRATGLPPIVQFSDPDAVREVFATGDDVMHAGEANAVLEPFLGAYSVLVLDGARHRSQRRLLLPPFRGERMRAYGEAMHDITASASAKWPRAPGGGARFVLQRETQAITLDVILRTVFGMEDGADQDRMRALLARALRILDNPLYIVRTFQKDYGPLSPRGAFPPAAQGDLPRDGRARGAASTRRARRRHPLDVARGDARGRHTEELGRDPRRAAHAPRGGPRDDRDGHHVGAASALDPPRRANRADRRA